MIYLVLENEYNVIDSFSQKFIARYPRECRVRVSTSRVPSQIVEQVRRPPLFRKNWLILCSDRVPRSAVDGLSPEQNTILITVNSRAKYDRVVEQFREHPYLKCVDNYRLDTEVVVKWVCDSLQCASDDAKFLYDRVGGSLKDVVSNVQLLSVQRPVDRATMRRFVQAAPKARISDVVPFLLGTSERVTFNEIVQLLYLFRFAVPFVIDTAVSELEDWVVIFQAIESGRLTLQNFRHWREQNNQIAKRVSEYKLKQVVEAHGSVSLEKVYYYLLQLNCIRKSPNAIFKLILLMKTGGNDEGDL